MTSLLRIGALIDFEDWGFHIFNATIHMINDRNDGMWDSLLDNDTVVEGIWRNDTCDESTAVDMYWDDIRAHWYPELPHAVIGCHCSGASAAMARVAGLENVPVVSMSSTSYRLSDVDDFTNFFRTVAPDDDRGQVGAMVALFRSFGWDRVTIIGTDTQYSRDMVTKFQEAWVGVHSATLEEESKEWTGDVAYSHIVSLQSNGDVSDESVMQAFDGVPTDKPVVNSRVVVLIATADHASRILSLAFQTNFQPDTIWIGSDGWVGRPSIENVPLLPPIPGFMGLAPFHSRNSLEYQAFLKAYNEYQAGLGNSAVSELPIYAAETVDAILAVVRSLVRLSPDERGNGTALINNLYSANFSGLSGRVAFDPDGRFRKDPQFQLLNLQQEGWQSIPGTVTTGSVDVPLGTLCWPSGCNLTSIPSEKYEVPGIPLPTWVYIVIPAIALIIVGISIKYLLVKKNFNEIKKKIDAIDNIDEQLANINVQVEDAKKRQHDLLLKREELQEFPKTWSTSNDILIEVLPEDDQYWTVNAKLRQSMNDAWISKLWRVQNKPLWTYYSFHKNRFAMNGINDEELSVWHGTSKLEPSIIHSDTQDGFMMQFSRKGLWGRGIYFATKSSYSHSYAYKPNGEVTQHEDEREMFLAKLLVGKTVEMNRDESPQKATECSSLTVPPIDPLTGMKYNTVTGWTGGSHIWVVYENGRGYPDYLVRYYRGTRDPARTPYESRPHEDRATSAASPTPKRTSRGSFVFRKSSQSSTFEKSESTLRPETVKKFVWEYEDKGWLPIASGSQAMIDSAYMSYKSGVLPASTLMFKTETWTYEIDFDTMRQTNISHSSHRQRNVRRREIDVDADV